MGYAGYTAAKLPPPKATILQSALWSIDNMECLEVKQYIWSVICAAHLCISDMANGTST